jgi:hypothetical protein
LSCSNFVVVITTSYKLAVAGGETLPLKYLGWKRKLDNLKIPEDHLPLLRRVLLLAKEENLGHLKKLGIWVIFVN